MHRCKVLVPGGDEGLQPMKVPVGFQRLDIYGSVSLKVSVHGDWLMTLAEIIKSEDANYVCSYEERGAADDGGDIVVDSREIPIHKVEYFCKEFADFLEIDPRHNFTIKNCRSGDAVTLDEHNFIYCTGKIERFEAHLIGKGLAHTEINLPTPHVHQLHDLFDDVVPKFIEALKSLS